MMNKFVAMTAVSIFATAIAHGTAIANSGVTSAADIATTNPSFEADAPADGESKNSSAGGWMVAANGTGNRNEKGSFNWWRNERARRLADIEDFLEQHKVEFDSFRAAPLGIKIEVPRVQWRDHLP